MANLKRIGALWKTRKQGFITGNLELALDRTVKVGVGVNTKKRDNSRDPDFYIYLLPDERVENPTSTTGEPPDYDEEPPF